MAGTAAGSPSVGTNKPTGRGGPASSALREGQLCTRVTKLDLKVQLIYVSFFSKHFM